MFSKWTLILVSVALPLAIYWGWKLTARGAYESADYQVVKSDGPFEIREYPQLKVVSTAMDFESQGDDGSFMRLFEYISGENDSKTKVAMTTPVFMDPSQSGQMSFVLPKDVAQSDVPQPRSDQVKIAERQAGRFAVYRFDGRLNRKTMEASSQRLRDWLQKEGLTPDGEMETAGYDPPWTPGPLRRNEVLIRIR